MSVDLHRPGTTCLRLDHWPPLHQQAWQAAFEKAGLFDEDGLAAQWRPASIEKTRKGYGAWLHWIAGRQDPISPKIETSRPGDLATRGAIEAYVEDLSTRCSSMTVYNRIQELYDAIRVMAPHQDWSWLKAAMDNLRGEARPSRNKLARLQMTDRLEELGLQLMDEAEASPKRNYRSGDGMTELQRAIAYRDGLVISLLARRPFRIKNFCALTIGENLIVDGATANLVFTAAEMKGKRPIEAAIPSHLLPRLNRYLKIYRPILLTGSDRAKGVATHALWMSRDGTELAEISLHNAIRRRTEAAFGAPMPPHWFRDAAVTTLVRDEPESARITGAILGHATPDIATKHYNQALMVDAGRRHQAVMKALMSNSEVLSSEQEISPCAP